eukprot:1698502-Amphidinium_carterae.1
MLIVYVDGARQVQHQRIARSAQTTSIIQASANGVRSETLSMKRVLQTRNHMLEEHVQTLPTCRTGNSMQTRQQAKAQEESEEIAMLRAKLRFPEQNMEALTRLAECENTVVHVAMIQLLTRSTRF